MSARDEPTPEKILMDWMDENGVELHGATPAMLVSVLRSKGYRKPRTITTAEELDALPAGKKVVSGGYEWTKQYSTTYTPDHAVERDQWFNLYEDAYDSNELTLPAIVLWEPEAEATR